MTYEDPAAYKGGEDEALLGVPVPSYEPGHFPKVSNETGRGQYMTTQSNLSGAALTNRDLEIVRAEMAKGQFELSGRDKLISWGVLMILLLA